MGLGPFDLTGGPFLVLYLVVLALAWGLSRFLQEWFRPEGRPGKVSGEDDLAALAGGKVRLAEAAATRLLASGKLVQQGDSSFLALDPQGGNTPAERTILGMAKPAKWKAIQAAVDYDYWGIAERLIAAGLMMEDWQHRRLKVVAAAPLLLALCFGAIKLFIGLHRQRPVFILALLLIATGALILISLMTKSRVTAEGRALLRREATRNERLRRAPMDDEMGLSVALYGTAVLAGSAYSDFHAMRQRQGDSGGDGGGSYGSDSGSDGGGGGCGGGGCGGCGG